MLNSFHQTGDISSQHLIWHPKCVSNGNKTFLRHFGKKKIQTFGFFCEFGIWNIRFFTIIFDSDFERFWKSLSNSQKNPKV